MKAAFVAAAALSLVSLDAHAISRYNSQDMSCDRVQAAVRDEGAVILRFTSSRNLPLYDRYVAHAGYCSSGEYAQVASVPTSDERACTVLRCVQYSYDEP